MENPKELMNDANGKPSTKRKVGIPLTILGAAYLAGLGIAAIFVKISDPDTALAVGQTLIWSGCALLGIGVVEFIKRGNS